MQKERFINVRKLAALSIYFRGAPRMLAESGAVVFAFGGLGLASIFLGSMSQTVVAIGVYLFLLAVDYTPLFAYAVVITRKGDVSGELGPELAVEGTKRRYGVQQVLVLVPFFIPALSVRQEMANRRGRPAGA